ncbi:MAG: YjhG/YagF family D-xylonate dehydratase [Candidatus Poribacteria bacterium]|nr:YjhG/YagF family D-xylonate dehydratase [Candidatus Poribacteria bacterium]
MAKPIKYNDILDADDSDIYDIQTHAAGPEGSLPLTAEMLLNKPSGDIFGLSHNTAMGWAPTELRREEFLILSTQGGIRAPDGSPIALGYHTGHWEVGLLMQAVAHELKELAAIPFAGYCSDPCDGRTQGTVGMMDSLAYRNDAAQIFRRLIRSLPTRKGVVGVATCDKGLPAMMMALASMRELPAVLVPGGVTLPPTTGEDAGKIQTIGARFAHGEISLQDAADMGCRACATPGGGCQFLGTAATSQVVGEALGMSLTHSALAPSGQNIWSDMGLRSARAVVNLAANGLTMNDIVTPEAIQNAMVVHAAFGGSTNLLLHIPAIAHAAGLQRPTVDDWTEINQRVPRLVDVLPNGPVGHPTVRVFLAGGVPEVMLHLRKLGGLLNEDVITATGKSLGSNLDWWETSERRKRVRELLEELDNVAPDEVILDPDAAKSAGLTSTVTFPRGNLAPEGSVIKSTAIDPSVVDADGVYRLTGPARVFVRESDAIQTLKGQGETNINPGDIMVLCCRGPQGTGMEEVYQLTAALKHLSFGKQIALITDARFSGVSTGACIGHVGPEALADGPIGKVLDGDIIQIEIDTRQLVGSIDLVGYGNEHFGAAAGERVLAQRQPRPDLSSDKDLPDDTRLWAALQSVGGGTWGGCVYDVDAILDALS